MNKDQEFIRLIDTKTLEERIKANQELENRLKLDYAMCIKEYVDLRTGNY